MNCVRCGTAIGADARFCPQCGAPRPRLDPRFERVEQEVARLRDERKSGRLSADRYKAALHDLMIEHERRWWMLGTESGKWYVNDGKKWVEAVPPTIGSGSMPGPAASVAAHDRRQFSLRLLSGRTTKLVEGSYLRASDLGAGDGPNDGTEAQVLRNNPDDPTILGLKNLSQRVWTAVMPDGSPRRVEPGRSLRLDSGTTVDFGSGKGEVISDS